jgi:YbbR domain-containing protein
VKFLGVILAWVKASLFDNVGLKAIALVFAIGLFVYLHGQQEVYDRAYEVGLFVSRPPETANRELMTQVPPDIHVTLRGPMRALERLMQQQLPPIELDLRDGLTEVVTFDQSMLTLPPGVEVVIFDPPNIRLEWQEVVERTIPLQAAVTGQPAEGYLVNGRPEVEPKDVRVRGPKRLVEEMQFVRLAAFDVTGLTSGTFKRPIAVDNPPPRLSYVGFSGARVTVNIARRMSEAKFERLPVEVVGVPAAIASPRHVGVTVVGPPEVVRALTAEQVAPRADLSKIDLRAQPHGSMVVKLSVDLANAEALVQPPTVTVRW